MGDKTLKEIIKHEFIEVLKEVGQAYGSCGQSCPCASPTCKTPIAESYILPNGIKFKVNMNNLDSKCSCQNKTPLMPDNQVTQFGNTTEFQDNISNSDQILKIKKIISLLKNKPQIDHEYNDQIVKLNTPIINNNELTLFILKNGVIKKFIIKI